MNEAQPSGIENSNQVDKPSVPDLNATDAKEIDAGNAKEDVLSNCGRRATVTAKFAGEGDTRAIKEKSETKRLKADRRSTEENSSGTSAKSVAAEVAQSGSANTVPSMATMIPHHGPSPNYSAQDDVTTSMVSLGHRQRTIENRSWPSRGISPSKERIVATEQIVIDGRRSSHIRTESQPEEGDVKASGDTTNSLLYQRTEATSPGQVSSPVVSPAHSSTGRGDAVSGSSHIGTTTAAEVCTAYSAGNTGAVSEHRTLAATPTMIEVGIAGGTHGWLKVRAELAGDGAVHASVSSASSSGEEMLRRELPLLTTYLHHERVPVSSLVVHASTNTQDFNGMGGGDSHYGEAKHQQQTDREASNGQQKSPASSAVSESWARGDEIGGMAAWLPSIVHANSGGWFSVRA